LAAEQRPTLYFVRLPLSWTREFTTSLRAAGIDAPASAAAGADAGPRVTEIGVPDALVTTRIDTADYVERKRAALACHRSQLPPEHFLMRMPMDLARRLWACEFYSREAGAPGCRGERDLFAEAGPA
jgi:LmbE family N-acetylglucosaminyl deacetylase